jgi:hypothetical protein
MPGVPGAKAGAAPVAKLAASGSKKTAKLATSGSKKAGATPVNRAAQTAKATSAVTALGGRPLTDRGTGSPEDSATLRKQNTELKRILHGRDATIKHQQQVISILTDLLTAAKLNLLDEMESEVETVLKSRSKHIPSTNATDPPALQSQLGVIRVAGAASVPRLPHNKVA